MIADFRKRFWVTLILTILFLSPMIQDFFGYEYLLPGNKYILFALSTVVYFYGDWPFLKGFFSEIKKGAPGNVGIAVGSGTDVAAETADIILVNSNPQDIANFILLGKATYDKMIQNLVRATGYNVVAIPLAAGVLYSTGFVLGPAVGAVLMSLSTVIVAINAQLLRGKMGNNKK